MSSVSQPARGEDRRGEVGDAPDELSEPAVRTLLDRLPAILYVADVGVGGRWHYISSGATDILGFTPAEWTDDPGLWARQVHPDDRERVFGREDELVEPSVPDEYRFLHRDGRTVWVRDEAALVSDEQGRMRWHGVMSDVTERKLAEAELERPSSYEGVTAELDDRGTWPPMPVAAELVDLALRHARDVGLEIGTERSGGVSDGCWTGKWGIPTLDGLGPAGGDDHTEAEWIEVATLEQRLELTVRLIESVCAG